MNTADRVIIFDTTLRDGEQSPGASMNIPTKLKIAHGLQELGVDVIEAGFPVASPDDFRSVHRIATDVRGPVIAALARARAEDIEQAGAAIAPAERGRIHTFIATSEIHRVEKLDMSEQQVIDNATRSIEQARRFTDDVEFSPEDAGRTDLPYLAKVVEAAIQAGATTINIPDTVGYCTPDEYARIFQYLIRHVPNINRVVLSTHCHDDLGMATANTLAGIRAGARQAEVTINGIGERAGNASLDEVVMAMNVRPEMYPGLTNGIVTQRLKHMSNMVADATWPVQRNKAISGQNAFAHEAGIHQHGMMQNRRTYEIMRPEDVGVAESDMVLGKHSSSKAMRERATTRLGLPWRDQDTNTFFERFKQVADGQVVNDKYVTDDRLREEVYYPTIIELTGGPTVTDMRHIEPQDGRKRVSVMMRGTGDTSEEVIGVGSAPDEGDVDAIVQAFRQRIPTVDIVDFKIGMLPADGPGASAPAIVTVQMKNGIEVTVSAHAKDTTAATLEAVQRAFNALCAQDAYAKMIAEESSS